jgi:hypothetical protein
MSGIKYLLDTNFILGLLKATPDVIEIISHHDVVVENGYIVLSKLNKAIRVGWAEAAAAVAAQAQDDSLMGDFSNIYDASCTW